MTGKKPCDPTFDPLFEELINDVTRLTDVEIFAEFEEEGANPAMVVADMRELIQLAILDDGKARLARAKAAVQQNRSRASHNRRVIGIPEKKALLERVAANDPKLKSRLTMAARNGEGITEEEMSSILEDLLELGAIDDTGNLI
ncbi:hypothetical protein [Sphingopyxis sp.]|uniref:hypothetical protein n=1 Tax=Sphingopyxis sp. TaxID=1908224 RepID=UPI003D0BE47A